VKIRTQTQHLLGLLAAGFLLAWTGVADAQSRFSPVVQVGDAVITRHQLDQRTRFLALLRAPGDPRILAREQLINEAVQQSAAAEAEIEITPEKVQEGLTEFAARANLTAEQFVAALAQNGVQAETFRDFVSAGLAWREYVRNRFRDTAREFPPELIRRTLAQTGTEGGLRVLVSEILLPTTTPETAAASRERAARISSLGNEAQFAAAAREFSVAPSAARGGELNWIAIDSLPDNVRPVIEGLTPGQISRPIELENAVGVFLLRDAERAVSGAQDNLSVDYALFVTDGDQAAAFSVAREVDVCDDLYGVARGLPEDRLIRETVPTSELPSDIRAEISDLDQNEISTSLTRGGRSAVLMLCERKPALESTVDLDIVGNRLLNIKLETMASKHLEELRASSIVIDLSN
jgi:peptidyl-prolyl cis-trans isomerase SurA